MKMNLIVWLFCVISFKGIAQSQPTIRVALASSLIHPLQEIKAVFEQTYEVRIELIPGASSTLTNQILNGAPNARPATLIIE